MACSQQLSGPQQFVTCQKTGHTANDALRLRQLQNESPKLLIAWAVLFAPEFWSRITRAVRLHARSDCFLMEGRNPLATLLLPDRTGDHLRSYLRAATGSVLARLVRHEDRIFVEPHVGEIRQAETGDGAVCRGHAFDDVVLAAIHRAARDVNRILRQDFVEDLRIFILPPLPTSLLLGL